MSPLISTPQGFGQQVVIPKYITIQFTATKYIGIRLNDGGSYSVRNNISVHNSSTYGDIAVGYASENLTTDGLGGLDVTKLFIDPFNSVVAKRDFHLTPGSALAIDQGVTIPFQDIQGNLIAPVDFDGNSRPLGANWDLGAYEAGGVPPNQPDRLVALGARSSITINGDLNELDWREAESVSFSNQTRSDNQVTVYTLWDTQYLYFGYLVSDKHLEAQNMQLWEDDSAEIYLDANNNKSFILDADDHQLIGNIKGSHSGGTGVLLQTQTNSSGYTLEIAIPWSALNLSPIAWRSDGTSAC